MEVISMYTNKNDIAVVTSGDFAKSGGIQTVTQTLFKDVYPIFFLEKEENLRQTLKESFRTIIFSGFDQSCVDLARDLKESGKKLVVFWHFSSSSEVDVDLGVAWKSLLPLLTEKVFDLFVTCKRGMTVIPEKLLGIPSFWILNNAMETQYASRPKDGIGIYSGSTTYWVKNLFSNMYAALATGMNVDFCPYDASLQASVEALGMSGKVTGANRLPHEAFLERLASRELVSYVTFCEGAPILPLEAFNNGVICLTGNNHDYFETDSRLRDLTVVNRPDDPTSILEAIQRALDNKAEILQRYSVWKKHYDQLQESNFYTFMEKVAKL